MPLLWFVLDTSHLHQLCLPNWWILCITFWAHGSKAGDSAQGPCCQPALTFVCTRHLLLLTRPCLEHVVATPSISPHLFLFWVGPHAAPHSAPMTEPPPSWRSGTYEKTLKTQQGISLGTQSTYTFCGTNNSKRWALEWGKTKELPERRHVSAQKRVWLHSREPPQHGASARLRRKIPVPAANGAAAVARNRSALPPCGLLRALRPAAPRPGPSPRTQKSSPHTLKQNRHPRVSVVPPTPDTRGGEGWWGLYSLEVFLDKRRDYKHGHRPTCSQASSPLFSPWGLTGWGQTLKMGSNGINMR